MVLFDEQEIEEKEPEGKKPTDWTGVIIFVALLPMLFYFRHLGKTDLGLNLSICLAANLVAVRIHWDLRRHPWFLGVVILVTGLEIPLILNIQWPRGWVPGVALLPIGIVGFLIAHGAIELVEKFIVKSPPDDSD